MYYLGYIGGGKVNLLHAKHHRIIAGLGFMSLALFIFKQRRILK